MLQMSKPFFIVLFFAAIFLSMTDNVPAQRRPKATPTPAAAKPVTPPEIAYTVSMSKPWTHLLEVEMRVRWDAMPERLALKMPVWTPGSYLIREYARHV